MKLTIIGGGGFRVPQVHEAVARPDSGFALDELCLHDVDPQRLDVIMAVIREASERMGATLRVTATTSLSEALTGADFIFSAVRIGGTSGRVTDELTALDLGLLGQETVGPGGYAYALRTIPYALHLAHEVKRLCPEAWVINFTNPAGIITQTMRTVLGARVLGICDTPIGLVRRTAHALGAPEDTLAFDYVGLNHLGWLRSLDLDGTDHLPRLLGDDALLDGIEEARVIGKDWVRGLGALPNEYLFYYYNTREAVARIRSEAETRGQFLDRQQRDFFTRAHADLCCAHELWHAAHDQREATYMAEARAADGSEERREADIAGGGYQEVALNIMKALTSGIPSTMILDVANTDAPGALLVPELREDAVLEVPCTVDGDGVHPHRVAPVRGHMLSLMSQVKYCEENLIDAALHGDRSAAWRAIGTHPLVDSISVARTLLDRYEQAIPEVGRVLADGTSPRA